MKPKLRPINNQVVVLFGATSGIGLETALKMAGKGTKVVIVGRNQEGLDQAVERVQEHARASMQARSHGNGSQQTAYHQPSGMIQVEEGGALVTAIEDQVIGIEADITNWDQVKSVAEQVIQRFGRIDTWVNIASVSQWALFEDTTPEEFRRVIEVNLIGQSYGAMAALPYMKQQRGGAIIFVSSVAGRVPLSYQSAYSASKHGIIGMAETIRQELKHSDLPISITTILPSSVNTPLYEKARTKMGVQPDPVPPVYDTKLVARAIIHAAQRPVNELIVGDAGYMVSFMRRLAPTLTNNVMGRTSFNKARSNEPKSAQAPDNLFHHIEGYNQVIGEYGPQTKRFSLLTWLSTHPRVRLGLLAGLLTGTGFLIGKRMVDARRERRSSFSYRARKARSKAVSFLAALPLIGSLPMFQRRSLGQRVRDLFPRKSLADRLMDEGRARLPDQLPLEEERRQLAKTVKKERDIMKNAMRKQRDIMKNAMEKERKVAARSADKQREMIKDRVRK